MRVLHFEDSAYKSRAIRDVLESCRVTDIDSVMYLDDGVELYRKAVENGNPYDLIITQKSKGNA